MKAFVGFVPEIFPPVGHQHASAGVIHMMEDAAEASLNRLRLQERRHPGWEGARSCPFSSVERGALS